MLKKRNAILSTILITAFSGVFQLGGITNADSLNYRHLLNEPAIAVSQSLDRHVIPIGKSVGVTMNIDGVMVVGTCEILCDDGSYNSPSQNAGIKNGDIIKSLNGSKTETVSEMNEILDSTCGNSIECMLERDGTSIATTITPVKSREDNSYKIGAWVKDAASGIGTITYCDPQSGCFGALGHGICDSATGDIIKTHSGSLLDVEIAGIKRGEKGSPGELNGVFSDGSSPIGEITDNNNFGLFGRIINSDFINECGEPLRVLRKDEVTTGKAQILCNVDGSDVPQCYDIEIQKVFSNHEDSTKGMIIKVCDEKLIQKTGGIVQGMSGSPIIRNGCFIGAVTHVFVNDPTRGYGIFGEVMLSEAE